MATRQRGFDEAAAEEQRAADDQHPHSVILAAVVGTSTFQDVIRTPPRTAYLLVFV
jgi:hypothetical protein